MEHKLKTAIRIFANIVLMGFAIPMIAFAIYLKGAIIYYYEPAMHILVIEVIIGLFAVSVSVQYVFEKVAQVAKEDA